MYFHLFSLYCTNLPQYTVRHSQVHYFKFVWQPFLSQLNVSYLLVENEWTKYLLLIATLSLIVLAILCLRLTRQKKELLLRFETLRVANEKQVSISQLRLLELHHRVKNNLSIVLSLMNLQAKKLTDKEALVAFQMLQKRIEAMAMIHQQLREAPSGGSVNMQDFVRMLTNNCLQSFGYEEESFDLSIDVNAILLDIETAIPVGLILNEVITNAFKHAYFHTENPQLAISIQEKEGFWLEVKDNGVGIDWQKWEQNHGMFGKQLIQSLTKQIDGRFQMKNENGTYFSLYFGGN